MKFEREIHNSIITAYIADMRKYTNSAAEKTQSPLRAFIDQSNFKIYLNDVGLLSTLAKTTYQDLQLSEDKTFRGALTENYIAQTLISNNHDLVYFKPSQTMEIDFLLNEEGEIIPIEVKSGIHIKSRSLSNYLIKYKPKYAMRVSARNFGFNNNIYSIPLYAAFCIGK